MSPNASIVERVVKHSRDTAKQALLRYKQKGGHI